MNEREIFHGAIEIPDVHQRHAYLDQTCGTDVALRQQVELLLRAHDIASQFLATPAAEQLGSRDEAGPTTVLPQRGAATSAESNPDDDSSLEFLTSSAKPESLGRLAHYEVLEVLGRGAFGIVLKAFDEKLHRMVAIKVMNPDLAATSPPRKRFLREAQSSAKVRHENIVAIHAVEEQPVPYLVMDYIPGGTLQQRLDAHGPLELTEILRLGQQIATGLAAAHAQGLIHRDIKPANILLEGGVELRAKITDFGLARATDDASLTQSGLIAGTPLYMAPEQAKGQPLDHRADLFSLGSVLYTMTSGRPPFRAPNTIAVLKRLCEDTPRPITEVIPETPSWLCDVIAKLHAKDPADRYQTATEVARVLGEGLAHLHDPVRTPRPVTTAPLSFVEPSAKTALQRKPAGRSWTTVLLMVIAGLLMLPMLGCLLMVIALAIPAYQRTQYQSKAEVQGTGTVTLLDQSDSPNAVVRIDGRETLLRGRAELTLWAGPHVVTFIKDGFPQSSQTIHVVAGQNQVVRWPEKPSNISLDVSDSVAKWQPLFNGRDLTGWKTHPQQPGNWRGEDGAIVGSGSVSHLFTERDDFHDFEFRGEVRLSAGGNSGIFIRTGFALTDPNAAVTSPPGYEVQLVEGNNLHPTQMYLSGGIIPLANPQGNNRIQQDRWARFRIKAVGETFESWIDDVQTAVVTDPQPGRYRGGHLALQVWSPETKVEFRKLEVKQRGTPSNTTVNASSVVEQSHFPPTAKAPFDASQAQQHQNAWAKHLDVPVEYTNELGMKFRLIPPGEFLMGSPAPAIDKLTRELTQAGANDFDKFVAQHSGPQHRVTITKPFYLGEHEVTVGQYRRFIATKKYLPTMQQLGVHRFKWDDSAVEPNADNRAVVAISWDDAQAFCDWVSEQTGITTEIPTEAQWEYACRAGTTTLWSFGDDPAQLSEYAVFSRPGFIPAEVVGTLKPNSFSLFDMHGNADEWCRDWHDKDFYGKSPIEDPVLLDNPTDKNSGRVARGGTAHSAPWWTYSTTRPWDFPATPNNPKGVRVTLNVDDVHKALHAAPPAPVSALEPENDWHSLFNGRDMTGWKTHPDKPGMWRVEDGAIVGDSRNQPFSAPWVGNYLFSERNDYDNFHLRCEVQINRLGDAGILFRTVFAAPTELGLNGYEAQIESGRQFSPGWNAGAIATVTPQIGWKLRQASEITVRPDEWFPMEVIAIGTHIETWVNGKKVAEYNDPERHYIRGHIVLQQSTPETRVMFRKIEVRPL